MLASPVHGLILRAPWPDAPVAVLPSGSPVCQAAMYIGCGCEQARALPLLCTPVCDLVAMTLLSCVTSTLRGQQLYAVYVMPVPLCASSRPRLWQLYMHQQSIQVGVPVYVWVLSTIFLRSGGASVS